jgi:Ca2+:H+ antiporter
MAGRKPGILSDLRHFFSRSWLNVLLVFIPVSIGLEFLPVSEVLVFATAALAIIPLAGLISIGTEVATEHTGPGLGGFLNATFGNATELIIALFAVWAGLYDVVKASITGSILGNMLLVLGAAMIAGGWKRDKQKFNRTAAGAAVSMLVLAVAALVMPAVWDVVVVGRLGAPNATVEVLSLWTAVVLLVTYAGSLLFSLFTHRTLFTSVGPEEEAKDHRHHRLSSALILLTIATVLTAVEAEVLVGAVRPAAASLGMTELFIGVIIVAIIGNAAEHFTAIVAATKGQMDLSFNIAIGSSTQIALLVAPVLVLVSFLQPRPMDLVFNPFEIIALALAVAVVGVVSLDGESNWFEGLQLIAVYLILGLAFFFVPV